MENDKLLLFLLVKSVYLGHHLITGSYRWLNHFLGLGLDEHIIKKLKLLGFSFVLLRFVGPAVFSSFFLPLQKESEMKTSF